MNHPKAQSSSSKVVKHGCTIQVLGVGGAGGNAVHQLSQMGLPGVECAALNTDLAALAHCPVPTQIVLGSKSSRGLGAGGDPDQGRQAAEEDLDAIRALCRNAEIVFVVAGLGGGTGTGASPVVARTAKENGALVLSIVMLPFTCEGARRQRQAQQGLQALTQASDGVICLPNQKVFKLIDENTSLPEAFHITNQFVAQGVQGIWRLLTKPGLIKVDFADLCSVTKGKHAASALVNVEAEGEQRVRDLLDKLQNHPLFEGGQALAYASGILVSIAGGPTLSMKDVERVMEHIQRHGDQAHIIMGASVDPDLGDRIALTVVASGDNPNAPRPETHPQPGTPQATPPAGSAELADHLVDLSKPSHSPSRFVPPPPELTADQAEQIYCERTGSHLGKKRLAHRLRQTQLPLEIISKGRFEKSEPTFHGGEDLDVPTYIRRGVPLN
jgi:cell division protein FtsZ